ncbi:hypothetical protein HDU96_001526, partial [Phlyctochytrium bullatum]
MKAKKDDVYGMVGTKQATFSEWQIAYKFVRETDSSTARFLREHEEYATLKHAKDAAKLWNQFSKKEYFTAAGGGLGILKHLEEEKAKVEGT